MDKKVKTFAYNRNIPKNRPKIVVILGPTASGKSDLAVEIALQLSSGQAKKSEIKGAEIISADSRQVYKGLDLGSGKITKKEMEGIPHHMLDVANPKKTFTVSQYQKLGQKAIKIILKKNKIPIICGGTGLYIDSLIYNRQFPEVPPQPKLRKKLEKLTTEKLFEKLKKLDSRRAKNIDEHNRRRLIRALEIVIITGKPVPRIAGSIDKTAQFDTLIIGIRKSQTELKKAITKRLYKRLKQGMIAEIKNLRRRGLSWKKLDDFGLEYRFISRYLRGLLNKKEMEKLIIKESQRYAKRQMTWFKRDRQIRWITDKKESFHLIKNFLNK
ncbi:MAG: tRNA (adenosine(37)-N6)-dimethylallyltransferase MiaA [Patescibacteria group bacterium]